uniref:Uncharacterized protein n=1 Tax=Cacopsylla melanoneura TaxID=428564 RepID=A0A8D8W2M8_9HEMI
MKNEKCTDSRRMQRFKKVYPFYYLTINNKLPFLFSVAHFPRLSLSLYFIVFGLFLSFFVFYLSFFFLSLSFFISLFLLIFSLSLFSISFFFYFINLRFFNFFIKSCC